MIHKYWNVRLHAQGQPVLERLSVDGDASSIERRRVRGEEEKVEEKVEWIWRTLSSYEEKSATCISDMLLHVSNGAYVDGVMSAKRFILHVDLLFTAADNLDSVMIMQTSKGEEFTTGLGASPNYRAQVCPIQERRSCSAKRWWLSSSSSVSHKRPVFGDLV